MASLVNVLTALFLFLLPTVDQYYVSHQHWLLPFCLLCTKLLLAQSFKLLAASASLTSSGWQLLTSLEEMQASRLNSKSAVSDLPRTTTSLRSITALASITALVRRGVVAVQ